MKKGEALHLTQCKKETRWISAKVREKVKRGNVVDMTRNMVLAMFLLFKIRD